MPKRNSAHGHGTKTLSIPVNRCFACGKDNPDGMHLKFYFDEKNRRAFSRFRLPRRYQGPPGHAHGGIIATILDEAMGKVNKLRSVVALTSEMEIEYLKPVPLGQRLLAEGREKSVRGRRHVTSARYATGKTTFWRGDALCLSRLMPRRCLLGSPGMAGVKN